MKKMTKDIVSERLEGRGIQNDTAYIHKKVNDSDRGFNVVDVGITSWRRGDKRLQENIREAKSAGLELEGLARVFVNRNATYVEKELLDLGVSANLSGFNGASEYRLMTDQELEKALVVVEKAAMEITEAT